MSRFGFGQNARTVQGAMRLALSRRRQCISKRIVTKLVDNVAEAGGSSWYRSVLVAEAECVGFAIAIRMALLHNASDPTAK